MTTLADRELKPPRTKQDPLTGEALQALYQELGNEWQLIEGSRLEKNYAFKDFQQALDFTNILHGLVVVRCHIQGPSLRLATTNRISKVPQRINANFELVRAAVVDDPPDWVT